MASNSRKSTSGNRTQKFEDWREPLYQLRDRLKPLTNRAAKLHHAVVFSPMLKRAELAFPISKLEPLIEKKFVDPLVEAFIPSRPRTIVEEFRLKTSSRGFHGHFFISEDREIFEEFSKALSGIYKWLHENRTSRLVSWINVPHSPSEKIRELVHWVSLVYHYGYEKESHHLCVSQNFWQDATYFGTLPWCECPILSSQGKGWLTYQVDKSFDDKTREILKSYSSQDIDPPEVVEMCLDQDLVSSSLSVIDVMLYQLPTERARKKIIEKDVKEWRFEDQTYPLPNLKKKNRKTLHELKYVIQVLQRLYGWGSENDPKFNLPEEWRDYWTQKDVAICLKWKNHRTGEVNASKISRKFDDIFGTSVDDLYTKLVRKDRNKLRLFLDQRRLDVEDTIKHFERQEKAGSKSKANSKPLQSRKKTNTKSTKHKSP